MVLPQITQPPQKKHKQKTTKHNKNTEKHRKKNRLVVGVAVLAGWLMV